MRIDANEGNACMKFSDVNEVSVLSPPWCPSVFMKDSPMRGPAAQPLLEYNICMYLLQSLLVFVSVADGCFHTQG